MSYALVIWPGSEGLQKAVSHPAGLSKVNSNAGGPVPSVAGHAERMKLAKMAAERMLGASTPESAKEHQPPTEDHKGRVAGQKKPYDKFATGVSGDDSTAAQSYNKTTGKVSMNEIGSSAPESASAHQPKTIPSPKK